MSLFERIQNKRYDLQEAPIDDKGMVTPGPDDIKKEKKILKKFNKQQKKDKLSDQEISRRRSAQTTRGDAINRSMGTSGSTEGAGGANTGTTPPKPKVTTGKGVDQAEVSKDAKKFTKEIEKKRVKKLKPIDLNQPTKRVDLRKVEKKISRKRPSNAPSLVDVKKKIDVKNPVEMGTTGPKPVKGTVLKVDKGGFKRVRKTKVSSPGGLNPEAQKIIKKQVSADELIGNQKKIEKKIVKNTKNTSKPNLFSKVKSKIKGFHNYMVKDAGFRKTASKNLTKNTFKNTLRGNTLRNINKVLPGKYKALAALAVGAYVATRGKKKNTSGGVTGGDTKFTGVNPGLKLDTGKKNT